MDKRLIANAWQTASRTHTHGTPLSQAPDLQKRGYLVGKWRQTLRLKPGDPEINHRCKRSFTLETPGSPQESPQPIDALIMVLFAIHVGPPGCLQALRTDCWLV